MDMSFEQIAQEIGDSSPERTKSLPGAPARTMGNVGKLRYTHVAMIDQIISNPGISQNQLAALFGFTPAWVSNVMASDAFQAKLAERRAEIIDPSLIATVEERFKAMTQLSLDRLMQKLEAPQVSDTVVLKAVELGAKAMGVGGNAPPRLVPVDLSAHKDRLVHLHDEVHGAKTIEGTSNRIEEKK